MINNNYYEIDLDIWKQYPIKIVPIKQLDIGRTIRVNLYSNNYKLDVSKSKITIYIKKNGENIIFNSCKVIDINIIEIEITSSMVENIGRYNAEIDIISDGISTFNFLIEVIETNKNTTQITQSSEYKALVDTFKEVNDIDKKFIEVNSEIEEITEKITNKEISKLSYFSVSNIIKDTSAPTDIIYQHMKWQGINQTLIIMVNMINSTDVNPTIMNNSRVVNCIEKANSYGVKTVMLKPHLGINWSDGTTRYNLDFGTNTKAFLINWKNILLNYAEICNDNNIPILCIGCEQAKMITIEYKDNWEDIIDTIKAKYPNLLLTYAFDSGSGMMNDDNCIFSSDIDFIGLNLYPQWYPEIYNDNLTYRDLMSSAYNAYAPWKNGFSFTDRITEIYNKFNKKVYITEIGLMPYDDGLVTLISEFANDKKATRNYNVTALAYESIFNTFAKNPYVVGITLWAMEHPFCYFDYDSAIITYSEAEKVIKKYIESGELVWF